MYSFSDEAARTMNQIYNHFSDGVHQALSIIAKTIDKELVRCIYAPLIIERKSLFKRV